MSHPDPVLSDDTAPSKRWVRALSFAAVSLLVLVPRWITIFTESINWDEFALLWRVERTLHQGEVFGGGRPGLVTFMLAPLVRDCADAITVAVQSRILWQFFTLAYLFGVFVLVRNWFRFSRRPEPGTLEGAATVTLLGFLPSFVAWSVQVRTDQAALAAAVWGGVFLLTKRRRFAVLSGLLFGLSLLCTQKGIYPIALCGLLWATAILARLQDQSVTSRNSELFARATQTLFVGFCFVTTLALYTYLVPKAANVVDKGSVMSAWGEMQIVRSRMGYRAYIAEATRAPLHLVLMIALAMASVRTCMSRSSGNYHLLGTCWIVLLLGMAVVMVHGAGYPYFVMTAGLFPAVALGMASGHLAGFLGERRHAVIALAFVLLMLGSIPTNLELLFGRQANQRDTLRFIRESGLNEHAGYQIDGALICLADPEPLQPLSHKLGMGQLSPTALDDFIDEVRRRPVAYVVDLDRRVGFPKEIAQFWSDHYRWYYGSVSVAGFEIDPQSETGTIDVIVPGRYRWIPASRNQAASLEVNGKVVTAGSTAPLTVGLHRFSTQPAGVGGMLILALKAPPGKQIYRFIDSRQLDRLHSL